MAYYITQARYAGGTWNTNSYTSESSPWSIGDSSSLAWNTGFSILQIGVQSLPGVGFTLGSGNNMIYIGQTGIFELTLPEDQAINNFSINPTDSDMNYYFSDGLTTDFYIYVDIIYKDRSDST